MKKGCIKLALSFLFILMFSLNVMAQVVVNLHQPPPDRWNIEDLWSLTLTNTTAESYRVYLYATVEEAERGLVAKGNSSSFLLDGNFSGQVTRSDLEPVNADFVLGEVQTIVERTGTLPAGTYTICIYVREDGSDTELGSGCNVQVISRTSPPELISPENRGTVSGELPVFLWSPPVPLPMGEPISYTLKIVELLDEQVPNEAMNSNPAWFEEKDITSTSFQFPISARAFERGITYAWKIAAIGEGDRLIGESPVWSFAYTGGMYAIQIDSFFIWCDSLGFYSYELYVTNPDTNGGTALMETLITTTTPVSTPSVTSTPSLPKYVQQNTQQIVTGSIVTGIGVNKICFVVRLIDSLNTWNLAQKQICVDSLTCPCSCDDFKMEYVIDNTSSINSTAYSTFDEVILETDFTYPGSFIQVNAELIHYEHTFLYPEKEICKALCNKDDRVYGTFIDGPAWSSSSGGNVNKFTGSGWSNSGSPVTYNNNDMSTTSREIIWTSSSPTGVDFSSGVTNYVVIGVPEFNTCDCPDLFEFCIRYSFTDTECQVCEVVICYEVRRHDETIIVQ